MGSQGRSGVLLPPLYTSGLPRSPVEAYLRAHGGFPFRASFSFTAKDGVGLRDTNAEATPAEGEEAAAAAVHFGRWCVVHEDVVPYHFSPPVFMGDGAVLRPPAFLAFSLRGRERHPPGGGGPSAEWERTPSQALGTPRPFHRPLGASQGPSSPLPAAPQDATTAVLRAGAPPSPSLSFSVSAQEYSVLSAAAGLPRIPSLLSHIPVGPFCFIGPGVVSEAVRLKAFVFIGPRAVLGPQVEVMEGASVVEGSVVPAESLLAPYTVYEGIPAVPRGRVDPKSHRQLMRELLRRLMTTRRNGMSHEDEDEDEDESEETKGSGEA